VQAAAPGAPDLPWVWADLHRDQVAGADPMKPWREALAVATGRQYRSPVPPAMPAAFVLQWLLDVAATPAVYAAWHGSWLLDPLRHGLSFALDPAGHYPVVIQARDVTVMPALLDERVGAARAAYSRAAREVALSYHPGVNLGRHQRLAMVDDVWAMASARLRGQGPPQRSSCCFIVALPGTHECAGCPRLRTRPTDG
jgi:hypothetical protein